MQNGTNHRGKSWLRSWTFKPVVGAAHFLSDLMKSNNTCSIFLWQHFRAGLEVKEKNASSFIQVGRMIYYHWDRTVTHFIWSYNWKPWTLAPVRLRSLQSDLTLSTISTRNLFSKVQKALGAVLQGMCKFEFSSLIFLQPQRNSFFLLQIINKMHKCHFLLHLHQMCTHFFETWWNIEAAPTPVNVT